MIDKKFIGRKYPPTEYEIGFENVKEYALATGEVNPIFTDRETGLRSKYHGCLAPPCFATAYSGNCVQQIFFDEELNLDYEHLVHGEQEFDFMRPVVCGDLITTTGVIEDIIYKGGNDILVFRAESVNQRGELVTVSVGTFVIRSG
ncbi:MAG: MaoC family dehydratase N-terminal domain-containing protein [Actinobacteria bacterium]|nr:MaoC family dehydratase N-terminal domain-containing protein [Actinomycetota bacterium]